jgi:hypothetical protein
VGLVVKFGHSVKFLISATILLHNMLLMLVLMIKIVPTKAMNKYSLGQNVTLIICDANSIKFILIEVTKDD